VVAAHALGRSYPMRRIEIGIGIGIPISIPISGMAHPYLPG